MTARLLAASVAALLLASAVARAEPVTVEISRISATGVGERVGTVRVEEGTDGVSFTVDLSGLPDGQHGFHLHEVGDCGPGEKDGQPEAGVAAGTHFDPQGTDSHKGPTGPGHKGDLPLLQVTDGKVSQTVRAPRLTLADVTGRALVIHGGGDTYSDDPKDGGGGPRIACGVVPKS